MLKSFFQKIKDWSSVSWEKIKDWSGWSAAGSILTMRMEALAGFFTAVIGGLDWTPILSLDFTNAISNMNLLILGGVMFVKATVQEWVRRANANL